jgi:hypothetical protein
MLAVLQWRGARVQPAGPSSGASSS